MAYAGLSACVCGCVLDISTNLTITSPSNHSIEQSILKKILQQSTNPTIASLRHGGGIARRTGYVQLLYIYICT